MVLKIVANEFSANVQSNVKEKTKQFIYKENIDASWRFSLRFKQL